jgi:hypothetical protein
MYQYRDWVGYAGGLNLSIFLMSILPATLQQTTEAAKGGIGRTYFVTFLVVSLLYLASVWTVAYAFVPGGVYLRERTDLCAPTGLKDQVPLRVLSVQMLSLSVGVSSLEPSYPGPYSNRTRARFQTTLSLLSIVSLLVTLYRLPPTPRPFKPGRRIVTAGIWTVHFSIDNAGRDSQRRIRDLVQSVPRITASDHFINLSDSRDMQLDILGLPETDLHVSHNNSPKNLV